MRILATNPDTIGDVVLRQPMYQAILAAGHELLLMVRPLLAPVLGSIVPGARVELITANVYDPRLKPGDAALALLAAKATEFDPDLLLVAPYQWTAFSERLSKDLTRARVVSLSGRPFSDPKLGPAPKSMLRATEQVQVAEETPEVRKNEMLASAVLGAVLSLPDPAIEPSPEHLAAADAVLARLGLEPGEYWTACVGDTKWTRLRNWQPEKWAELLSAWSRKHGRKFLLLGQENEAQTTAEVRRLMGDQAGAAVEWAGRGDGDLDILLGLIARSRGYVGRDTGPMHIAAACRKPVLAVFGGGTWPRFLPQVDPSISLTVGVPCAGCNWVCHLPESYCIKEVPVADALEAADRLESGSVARREVRTLKPDALLLSRIGREGAVWGRTHLTQVAVVRRESMEQTQTLTESLERTAKQAGRAEMLAEELEKLRAEMARRESLLRQKLAATEAMYKARQAELEKRVEELDQNASVLEARFKKNMLAKLEAEARERYAAEEAQRAQRDGDLRSRFVRAQAELTQAQAENADLKLNLERITWEHGALSKWTKQLEHEVAVIRPRLHELMSSRWRKYGQRFHLCMVLPWEKEATHANGTPNGSRQHH
jgi:ADP-heptose:LPS heptosyltransferase